MRSFSGLVIKKTGWSRGGSLKRKSGNENWKPE
jgi:hypothetical protein